MTSLLLVSGVDADSSADFYAYGEFYRVNFHLAEVPTDIPNEAEKVYLHENQITTLKAGVFSNLHSCTYLDVEKNQISTIEAGAFIGLRNLTGLNLMSNELTEIRPEMWQGLESLTYVLMPYNKIKILPANAFTGLTKLKRLSLGDNKISAVSAFEGIPSLLDLSLLRNMIEPGTFRGLPKLKYLQLQEN